VRREFSAGGVVVRKTDGAWELAAIRPAGKPAGLWALPKGRIDDGESAEATAVREAAEETGLEATAVRKLGDVRYWFTWEGERIFKVVAFFLLRYRSGSLGDLPAAFRHEVDDTCWLPLEEAPRRLAYDGEREMARRAIAALEPAEAQDV